MTIAKAHQNQAVAVHSASLHALQPVALPAVLEQTQRIDGWREPQWVTRQLQPGEDIAIQHALLQLDQRLQRAPEGKTLEIVSRLLNNWKNDRTEDEKDWLFEDWAEDLEEFSEAHLAEACREWRRNNSFPPKIADIRGLCLNAHAADQIMHRRCRVLLGLEQPYAREILPERQAQMIELTPAAQAILDKATVGEPVFTKKKA